MSVPKYPGIMKSNSSCSNKLKTNLKRKRNSKPFGNLITPASVR